ncbi:pectin methylesterase, family CE8 [Zostera marina]|uniref:Pectin methylesterase, family CE8 n=1 Tax=Zostera marina TaxID=29655 RepID=A0A0K9PBV4_ZOSMR|nr:pectin methylesterase, family CE8 [Zostera marina]
MAYGRVVSRGVGEYFEENSNRRVIVIGLSSLLLLLIVIGIIVGIVVSNKNGDKSNGDYESEAASSSATTSNATRNATVINQAVKAVCSVTLHQESCYRSLSMLEGANTTTDPEELFRYSLNVIMNRLIDISTYPKSLSNTTADPMVIEALEICTELIDDSISQLNDSIHLVSPQPEETLFSKYKVDELRTWLSATITDQETCIDGFVGTTGGYKENMQVTLANSTEFASNSLAIADKILGVLQQLNFPPHNP